ncbi:MAG: septum formation inhibitor Maf [Betaproteobacteria bacterium SG8_40]|nr:MAG: septum formation inhibitor Maf [Betaproteobacteria bacterium SG8_40]
METQTSNEEAFAQLILASTSPYRRELLGRLQLRFDIAAPDIDESPLSGESGRDCAMRLARLKARAVGSGYAAGLVIGSDQVAECDGRRLDKPGSVERAVEQLSWASGKQAVFNTAVTLFNAATGREQTRVVPTTVRYRRLAAAEIERYLIQETAIDCAGSAKAEGLGISLLEAIECSDPTALIGLPLIALCEMLREENVRIP